MDDYRPEGVPLVFVRNVRAQLYGGRQTKYVSQAKAEELRAHRVNGGDVLVTKMGDPPGDADVYPLSQPPAIITADCIKIRCHPDRLLPQFLVAVINSPLGRRQIEPMTKGVAQKKVSLGRFGSLRVPLPLLDEQRHIVDVVESQLESVIELQSSIARLIALVAAQRQVILRAAFSGQLVPQDPNDEPASVLLDRIRAERQAAVLSTKRKAGRPAKAAA